MDLPERRRLTTSVHGPPPSSRRSRTHLGALRPGREERLLLAPGVRHEGTTLQQPTAVRLDRHRLSLAFVGHSLALADVVKPKTKARHSPRRPMTSQTTCRRRSPSLDVSPMVEGKETKDCGRRDRSDLRLRRADPLGHGRNSTRYEAPRTLTLAGSILGWWPMC